jgi:hypothetical protein
MTPKQIEMGDKILHTLKIYSGKLDRIHCIESFPNKTEEDFYHINATIECLSVYKFIRLQEERIKFGNVDMGKLENLILEP